MLCATLSFSMQQGKLQEWEYKYQWEAGETGLPVLRHLCLLIQIWWNQKTKSWLAWTEELNSCAMTIAETGITDYPLSGKNQTLIILDIPDIQPPNISPVKVLAILFLLY